jgi:hypothetical protein
MSSSQREIDRGERPLAFEGRGYAAPPPPRGGPAPVTLIASLIILALVGGGVFYLYRSGIRAPSGPPAPVGAPVGDIRVAAPPQAPQTDPAAGLSVYKDDPNAAAAAPKFAPPPEQPVARPQAPAVAPVGASVLYPVSANPAPIGTQAAAQPVGPATPAKPAKAPTIDTILAENSAAPAKPLIKAKPVADAAPVAAKAEVKAAAKTGGFIVQIGAFSSQALADKSWDQAAGVSPGQMAGKGKRVAPLAKNGATLYRTSITGFSTRAEAESLCAKLTAAGRTCFVR